MEIGIEWQPPLKLTKAKKLIVRDDNMQEEVLNSPGVYYFSRRFGPTYTPFYIGETMTIRARLKDHLNTVSIVDVLRGEYSADRKIAQGARYFHYGFFRGKSRQDPKKCIKIIERIMIRQAVEYGLPILNKSLTKIKTHSIMFDGAIDGRGWFDPTYSAET